MSEIQLEFVSTQELVEELLRRSAVAFIVFEPLAEEEADWLFTWKAPDRKIRPVLGLLEVAKHELLESVQNCFIDGSDGDEEEDEDDPQPEES